MGFHAMSVSVPVFLRSRIRRVLVESVSFLLLCIRIRRIHSSWAFHQGAYQLVSPKDLLHLHSDTILAGIMSACIFLLFKCIKTPGRPYGMVKSISKASYGIYLMHMLMLPAIFSTALLTYAISYCISILIGRLPFGKYIVG